MSHQQTHTIPDIAALRKGNEICKYIITLIMLLR
ncbi:hypothetical protein SAMN05421579_12147 [Xenorhabdus japonica]|uniref:Uncharacterized protein n=1 Tax=Xenorhabdus japonica TaxID=53341 RepID=A0A1I5BSS0_9GAMM|nr:hypothetical protein SAMN05421579_12147 [Xenorhabdus japonica]